jgi:RNA polymerase sigma-54 factor
MPGPTLNQFQSQRQEQRQELQMAPQQLQSLAILQATAQEVEHRIEQELAENPTLELVGHGTEQLVGSLADRGDAVGGDSEAGAQVAEHDETLATLVELGEAWQDYAGQRFSSRGPYSGEDEERRQFLFDSLVDEPGLQEFLLMQVRENDTVDDDLRGLAEHVIGNIDERGYLQARTDEMAAALGLPPAQVEDAVRLVQSFDPPGVGARDLRECLLLQLERKGREESLAYRAVKHHLDELGRNRIPQVAKALRISPQRLYTEVLGEIRGLTPFPGSEVSHEQTNYVVPEVYVQRDEDGQWQVQANRDSIPHIRIAKQYLDLLKDPEVAAEVKAYVREKIANSRLLLRAVEQRESTIVRLTRSLLEWQRDFFDHGPEHLRPLTMGQVADDLGLHETTISRTVAGKYIQTPHGIMPFRDFFSTGSVTQEGETVSSLSVKQKLQELVQQEPPKKPLSDQRLTDLLQEQGFDVARRTVAKYREELGILPSRLRRGY